MVLKCPCSPEGLLRHFQLSHVLVFHTGLSPVLLGVRGRHTSEKTCHPGPVLPFVAVTGICEFGAGASCISQSGSGRRPFLKGPSSVVLTDSTGHRDRVGCRG